MDSGAGVGVSLYCCGVDFVGGSESRFPPQKIEILSKFLETPAAVVEEEEKEEKEEKEEDEEDEEAA